VLHGAEEPCPYGMRGWWGRAVAWSMAAARPRDLGAVVLSAHAQALADQLADDDRMAFVAVPSPEFARARGMSPDLYLRHRAEILGSVGAAVAELRREGWRLAVRHVRGDEVRQFSQGAERMVIVTAEEIPEGAA
jgi:hypothetical protein